MRGGDGLPSLTDELDLITDAVRAAAGVALGFHRQSPRNWTKSLGSPVSEADIAVEKLLEARLRAARPAYGWLSEETEDDGSRLTAARTFIVDPIDGTRDFIAGGANWTIPVGLVEDGRPVAAALIAPSRRELFQAVTGAGTRRNGEPVRVSGRDRLDGARLALARRFLREGVLPVPARALFYASLAYRIARIADGRLDGAAIRPMARDWDLAAADLLVHEAGGRLCGLGGATPRYDRADTAHPALIAATPDLVDQLAGLVAAAEGGPGPGDAAPTGDRFPHGQRGDRQAGR